MSKPFDEEQQALKDDAQAWRFLVETLENSCEVVFQAFDGLQVMIYRTNYRAEGGKEDAYGFDEDDWKAALLQARRNLPEIP